MTHCYRFCIVLVLLIGVVVFPGLKARADGPPKPDGPAKPKVAGFALPASDEPSKQGGAQAGATGSPGAGATPTPTPAAEPTPTPPVAAKEGSAQLGDSITVKIIWDLGPDNKLKPPAAAGAIPGFSDDEIHKVVPYLNGQPLKGIYPEVIDPISQTLQFHLVWTQASKDTWKAILGNPTIEPRTVTMSVGLEDKSQIDSDLKWFHIKILPPQYLVPSVLFLLAVLIVFLVLAVKTGILKDPPDLTSPPSSLHLTSPPGSQPDSSYSLARVQMAIWFFVAIASFLLIWVTTGDYNTITGSTVVLIGISAATAVGATMIAPGGSPPTPNETGIRRFLLDILREDNSISFHRFQMLVFTLMFVIVFLKSVMLDLQMPQFDTGVLALMGISSGTYLGYKLKN